MCYNSTPSNQEEEQLSNHIKIVLDLFGNLNTRHTAIVGMARMWINVIDRINRYSENSCSRLTRSTDSFMTEKTNFITKRI